MNSENYVLAWAVYLISACVLLWALWKNTDSMGFGLLPLLIRGTAAVLLLLPYSIGDGYSQLAPAIIMFPMEALFDASPARVGLPLITAWLAMLVLCVVTHQVKVKAALRRKQEVKLENQRQELLDQSFTHESKATHG